MATELASRQGPISGRTASGPRAGARAWASLPALTGVALLGVIVYAAFAHGAVTRSTNTRVELVVAGLALVAALGWLWLGALRLSAPRLSVVGGSLLAAYACWSGLSVIWSVSPDASWIEVNRVITYTLVVCLGVAVGASHRRGVELIAQWFVVGALAVTLYALGQKVVPGLHIDGLFNLNQTGPLPRLQEPLGYWNALALFIAMAVPPALGLTVDRTRSAVSRLVSACALGLMLVTVPLTYSRGGLLALAVALAVTVGISRDRLRSAIWLLVVVLTALPAVLVGLLVHELSAANIPLGTREWAGGILAAAVLGGLALLVLIGRPLLARERRTQLSSSRAPALRRLAWGSAAALAVAGVLALTLSPRGFTGTFSQAWHSFASTHSTSNSDPQRLLSAASENRWVWWKEAAAAFSARPWQGWGAGSFPVVHLLYRRDTLPVQQPHSVPLQFLAETGVIGGILGIGALLLLGAGGVVAVRKRPAGRERVLAGALLGAAVGYGVHCLYDWDWNIPALSLPAFLFLGVVLGRSRSGGGDRVVELGRLEGPGWGKPSMLRAGGLAALTVCLCLFVLSVELPQLSADKASASLVAASSPSASVVRGAQSQAALASRLDPLSDSGLLAEADLALHSSQPVRARVYLGEAVSRNPSDPEAWRLLAQVDQLVGDRAGAVSASQRAIDLDPMGHFAQSAVAEQLDHALPSSSATRFP